MIFAVGHFLNCRVDSSDRSHPLQTSKTLRFEDRKTSIDDAFVSKLQAAEDGGMQDFRVCRDDGLLPKGHSKRHLYVSFRTFFFASKMNLSQ